MEITLYESNQREICKICIYQPETDTLTRIIFEDTIALRGKKIICKFVHEKTDTFIGIILEETITLHGKDNLHHLHIPTRN